MNEEVGGSNPSTEAVVVEEVASVKSLHLAQVKEKLAADQEVITMEAKNTPPVEETTKTSATDTPIQPSATTDEAVGMEDSEDVAETVGATTSDGTTVTIEQVNAGTSTPDDGDNIQESDGWKKLVQQLVNSVEKTSQAINEQQQIVVVVEDPSSKDAQDLSEEGEENVRYVLENGNDQAKKKAVLSNKRKRDLPRSRQSDSPIQDMELELEYRCWYCEEVFESNSEREDHEKMHTDSRFVLLICQQCGQSFRKSEDFEAHHRICGGEDDSSSFNNMDGDLNSSYSGENSNSHIDSPVNTELGKYECVFCDGHYISKENLQKHLILRHHLVHDNSSPRWYSCKYCDKDYPDRKAVLQHEMTHTSKVTEEAGGKFPCTYCGKCCRSRGNLIEHQRMHTGEKPYSCPHCGKACTRARDVREHIKRMHQDNGGKQLTCEYCYVIFATRQDLTDHLQERHNVTNLSTSAIVDTDATNLICKECGKEFDHKFKHQFEEHMATHTRAHLHTCDECGKTFVRGRELRYHQARHRGEGRYVCGLCNNNFVLKWDLKKHLKMIHNIDEDGSFDKIPNKKFKPGSPDKSMVMDDIIKVNPYVCRICNAQFGGGKELRAHRKTHVEEDVENAISKEDTFEPVAVGTGGASSFAYICSFCSKGFQDKNEFVVHVGSHTKGTFERYRNIQSSPTVAASPMVSPSGQKRQKKTLEEGEGVNFWKCCYGPCRKDAQVYNEREEFDAHIRQHMAEHANICEHCGRCFSRTRDLAYHKKIQGIRPCKYLPIPAEEEGRDPNEIANPLTGLSLSKKLALLQPTLEPSAQLLGVPPSLKLHQCGCGQKVQGFKEFQIHVLTHKSTADCEFCQYCGETFLDHDTLMGNHLKETCAKPCKYAPFALNGEDPDDMLGEDSFASTSDDQNGSVLISNGDSGDGSYSMVLTQPITLNVNNKVAGNPVAVPGKELFIFQKGTRRSPRQEKEKLPEKPFACRFCGKAFRARSYVREHETVHTKEANFECGVCDRRFTRARELRSHMKKHNGHEPWACDLCAKRFLNQVQYRLHMERAHGTGKADDEGGLGDMVDVNIVNNNDASTNMLGSKSFKCAFCSKHFTHLDHFKAHMEIVHDVEVSIVNSGEETEETDESQNNSGEILDEADETKEDEVPVAEVVQAEEDDEDINKEEEEETMDES